MNRTIKSLLFSMAFLLLSTTTNGNVLEFNTNNTTFDSLLKSGKPVVVKFYQPWCSACKRFEKVFDDVSNEFSNIIFVAVHCDTNKSLAQKYGISGYPTIIFFDAKGTVVEKNVGSLTANELRKKINKLK